MSQNILAKEKQTSSQLATADRVNINSALLFCLCTNSSARLCQYDKNQTELSQWGCLFFVGFYLQSQLTWKVRVSQMSHNSHI